MSMTTIPDDVEEMLTELSCSTGNSPESLLRVAVETLVARHKLRHIESIGSVSLPHIQAADTEKYLEENWAKSLEWR